MDDGRQNMKVTLLPQIESRLHDKAQGYADEVTTTTAPPTCELLQLKMTPTRTQHNAVFSKHVIWSEY